MSRFSLRSCADGLKLLEEKTDRRKSSNPTSISAKRISQQQKDTKYSTHLNDEQLIDDIKIESDETEKASDNTDRPTKNNSPGVGAIDDENEDNDNDNDDDDDDNDDGNGNDYRQQSPNCKGSLVCSLPLDRINDIIQKLNLNKSKVENEISNNKPFGEKETDELMVDETLDNYDDEEDDANISKQSASNIKNLCLYCERKFSSHKMQLKHVDKFHCVQHDRRSSGRKAQMQNSQVPRKRKSAMAAQSFPGCNYCQKAKGQSQPVILQSSELSSLFVHLTDCHADKYFGCKMCVLRFQNITKLSKHMEIVHKSLPFAFDESSSKSKDNDTDSPILNDKITTVEKSKLSLKRQQRLQKSVNSSGAGTSGSTVQNSATPQSSTAITPNTSVIGAEEPILSRLGLTQNRLPNNRKGVRLRREKLLPELLLKSEQNHTSSSSNYTFGQTTSASATTSSTCSPKLRGKALKTVSGFSGDSLSDVVFRVPTRNDILSCVFDDNFYKEVISNVRNNLLFHLDGKIMGSSMPSLDTALIRHAPQPQIRSTLVKSPIVVSTMDSEIHAATSLAAITAFPTLLTAEQFGGEGTLSKIRRPHTKNSWKWKWDNVKKFKLINEGGKIIKKMKHPMLGLRDLSKLDMWTQLTMRQKHELLQQQLCSSTAADVRSWHHASTAVAELNSDCSREEKQRLNDQLNFILDLRLLPHIILEQNEQAIIKLENDEFGISPPTQLVGEDCGDSFMAQTFADETFLSMLNLLPTNDPRNTNTKLVLSGEWARPRCYLCICCGAKFEKLKSLEEHKMFRHSQILSTHYEVVGRELLNGNLLRHLFIPKKALSRYGNDSESAPIYSGAARRLFWHKNETLAREITNNEESSDSLQSVLNSCTTNSPSLKNSSSSTDDCDIDIKMSTVAALGLIENTAVVSPTHSIQSCSSSSSVAKRNLKIPLSTQPLTIATSTGNIVNNNSSSSNVGSGCSKCGRKCNGVLDLYRHMLDCSGDYIWSLAKKRKYRYYCGSKKRRPCNKHGILELRKNKPKQAPKTLAISNDNTTEEGATTSTNFTKTKTSPRPRPSDAESIKKMLENLPPKRICKKIFPTLSKTKKTLKNVKPKLLAKHKIYNSLRKTHVRQISQAAKILSKTKSQLNKPKQISTRSTATLSSKAAKNRSNQNKNIKIMMNKSSKRKHGVKVSNVEETPKETLVEGSEEKECKDEVDCCNIKTENTKTLDVLENENVTTSMQPSSENQKNIPTPNKATDTLIVEQSKEKDEQPSKVELQLKSTQLLDQTINISSEHNISAIIHEEPLPTPLPQTNEVSESPEVVKKPTIAAIAILPIDAERNVQMNKNIKRSKRISDCIAMLTGKLEEKLKTEQKSSVVPTATEEKTIASTSQPPLKALLPSKPQPLPEPLLQLPLPPIVAEEKVAEKSSPKKTPKRKAISRRIIKADVVAEVGEVILPINPISVENNDLKSIKNVEIISPVKEPQQLIKRSALVQQFPTTSAVVTTTAATKTLSDLVFSQPVDSKQFKSIPSITMIAPMPPPGVIPLNTSTLMPKVPLYLPVEGIRSPISAPHIAPMPLSMPAPVPVPITIENVTQVSPGTMATANVSLVPTPVIPMMSAIPAHLPAPPTLSLTMSPFNTAIATAEPLNLSNTFKNAQKHSQDLSCSGNQRLGGIPSRRQTICGFEARNFVMFDEMEPLDLSKKPRPEKFAPIMPVLPRPIELAPLMLPPQTTLGAPADISVLTIPPLTPEALLNKPFYSNLDLLRIPQVRNPAVGQVQVTSNETPPIQPPIVINNIVPAPAPPPIKAANKKRNKSSTTTIIQPTSLPSNVTTVISGEPAGVVGNSTTTLSKISNTKDLISTVTTPARKESSSKNKSTLRMDEEVINHIDDAINSVINAVKASVDIEEAEKSQQELLSKSQNKSVIHPIVAQPTVTHLKTTDDVNTVKETVGEFKYLTAARRNMRSKTLDCRPAALNKINVKKSGLMAGNIDTELDKDSNIKNQTLIDNVGGENFKCVDTKNSQTNFNIQIVGPESEKEKNKPEDNQSRVKDVELKQILLPPGENLQQQQDQNKQFVEEISLIHNTEVSTKLTSDGDITLKTFRVTKPKDVSLPKASSLKNKDMRTKPAIVPVSEINSTIASTTTTTTTAITAITTITTAATTNSPPNANVTTIDNANIDLEQISSNNNNNTSSGFHSSAQSDQQTTSVMSSTTTSAISVPSQLVIAPEAKKKQRRRRKNELAAIVADQLLESFKLDKVRRDNLKKLENLAYEKSDDLLLTGMLLMPCTKRNVTSSSSANTNVTATPAVDTTESTPSSTKRSTKSQRNQNQNIESSKVVVTSSIENKATDSAVIDKSTNIEKDKDATPDAVESAADGKKNNKRRQYRRRGKTLDNENISKLKSSLESFSIDIERQLTEYEAKNVNVFNSASATDGTVKQSSNSKDKAPAKAKPSIILRPSILSVTLEASGGNQQENPSPPSATKQVTNDSNKTTVVSSRDPRLNKNIHKEGSEKNNDIAAGVGAASGGAGGEKVAPALEPKNSAGPEEIGDLEEDNYLTEIAKNVNEKIMSTAENEEFAFKDDGFEMVNDLGMDDSNSKFSRPPTSMSCRSAPNFNDDRSNFGSICDENTNTEVMDMDLDDEMSVYTSYSQDLGRGRGRRRRRRRSILLTRKPKKRATSRDMAADKIECILCKKVFYSANSLSKHNMTLAHVSKVSEQEYLLSKSHSNNIPTESVQSFGTLGPYAKRTTRRSTISEPPMQLQIRSASNPSSPIRTPAPEPVSSITAPVQLSQPPMPFKTFTTQETVEALQGEDLPQAETTDTVRTTTKSTHKQPVKVLQDSENDGNNGTSINTAFNGNSRLNLNPDERLFFECCNILKSAETPRINNSVVTTSDQCNINTSYTYSYNHQEKATTHSSSNVNRPATTITMETSNLRSGSIPPTPLIAPSLLSNSHNNVHSVIPQSVMTEQTAALFRDPQSINQSNCYNKSVQDNRNARSPTYSAISQLSAVTNTTSRFKTKAAMKGYENVNIDLIQQQESKSRTICKLTELAEIALGNEEKPNSHGFSPIQSSLTPLQQPLSNQPLPQHQQQSVKSINMENVMRTKALATSPDYAASSLASDNHPKECNVVQVPARNERTKNNETRSSTSSKTIMHSSIIKAAVEEHQKIAPPSNKIIIPDRPFKNIGLEEKETITFQKPKAPAVNLLTEDNSVSTGSFSDRDDYDFGSLSCDDEVSVRESNDKNQKNNSSESSSESSRATAKTFENKSLIMGRIFKNASTKATVKNAVTTVKVKSVGVQKDQTTAPKADLNQLFDELRGNSGVDGNLNDRCVGGSTTVADNVGVVTAAASGSGRVNQRQYQQQQREISKPIVPAASPPAVVSSTTATPSTSARKTKARASRAKTNVGGAKARKDISKLQTELGMSPDEIKKLIDEGQRKSKRRCATNRPKKLVEMWSSDEYEEFLSTKDIIALIEEKEQQEKRRKRKSSVNVSSNTSEVAKERDTAPADVTSSTKDSKRRNPRRMSMAVERPDNAIPDHEDSIQPKDKNKKSSAKKEDTVSTTAISTASSTANVSETVANVKTLPEKTSAKKGKVAVNNSTIDSATAVTTADDNKNISRKKRANSTPNKPKDKATAQKAKPVKTNKESSRTKSNKKPQYNEEEDDKDNNKDNNDANVNEQEDDDDDDDDDFFIADLKLRQINKARASKTKNTTKTVAAAASAAVVTSTANVKPLKSSPNGQQLAANKKRGGSGANNNNTNCNNSNIGATGSSNLKTPQQQQHTLPKNKRKNQTNQSPPRRKRLATEKLYYWSSSSDEDFGRINKTKSNPPADNYENNGEQYQKHGWIVGDSHKKLVTLLAIAKGNKKVDGVKKNVAKKRN